MAKQGKLSKKVVVTPSLELNEALWCGGLSGIVELYGSNSSGKTSLAIDTIAKNQREDKDFIAAWLETEGSVTENILKDHGIDMERLVYWRQEDVVNAENALDIARGFIEDGSIDMLVVNSVAGLSPSTEVEEDLKKQNIALTARLLSKFFRVANGAASKNDITIVFINQTRDNVGQMYGDPATTTGGKALGFYASQRIRMNMLKLQAADPIKEDEGVKIGFIIKKNRFAGQHNPFTKGEYYALYGKGIDSTVALPAILLSKGVVRQAGAYWYYEDENGKPITLDGIEGKFKSKAVFLDVIRNNKTWRDTLIGKINFSRTQTQEEVQEAERENEEANKAMDEIEKQEMTDDIEQLLDGNSSSEG